MRWNTSNLKKKKNESNAKPKEYYENLTSKTKRFCDIEGKCTFKRGGTYIKQFIKVKKRKQKKYFFLKL